MEFSPHIRATARPPILEAASWLKGVTFPADRPLINLSQAAPVGPPPEPLREEIARLVMEDVGVHLYGPDLGFPELRDEIAARWSKDYRANITADQVAVTSGCNQAFCAAIAVLAKAGDAVILPTPYYFNHDMHLRTQGIEARLLGCVDDMVPDLVAAEALIDARTKAIVLVTPNNPTGAEYGADVIADFYQLAKRHGIALILDETYRDFRASEGRPHALFDDPDWAETLIHLYSFSKTYRLTGHRVGAMVAGAHVLAEVEKYIDAVTICPNQIAQRAALFGLRHLGDWVADERAEILARKAVLLDEMAQVPSMRVRACGAYFAFIDHGQDAASAEIAQALVKDQSVLVLPASMFARADDPIAHRCLRVAFANTDKAGLKLVAARLKAFGTK